MEVGIDVVDQGRTRPKDYSSFWKILKAESAERTAKSELVTAWKAVLIGSKKTCLSQELKGLPNGIGLPIR